MALNIPREHLEPDFDVPTEHSYYTRAMYEDRVRDEHEWRGSDWTPPTYEDWLTARGESMPAPIENLDARTLRSLFETVPAFLLEQRGYTDAKVSEIVVTGTGYRLQYSAQDDFQASIPHSWLVHNGWCLSVEFASLVELWDGLRALPGRASRELQVLLRQTNSTAESAKAIRSELAKEFARELTAAGERYQNLLAKL